MAKSGKKQKPRRRREERLGICLNYDLALLAGSLTALFICGPPGQVTSGDMDCVMRYNFDRSATSTPSGRFRRTSTRISQPACRRGPCSA